MPSKKESFTRLWRASGLKKGLMKRTCSARSLPALCPCSDMFRCPVLTPHAPDKAGNQSRPQALARDFNVSGLAGAATLAKTSCSSIAPKRLQRSLAEVVHDGVDLGGLRRRKLTTASGVGRSPRGHAASHLGLCLVTFKHVQTQCRSQEPRRLCPASGWPQHSAAQPWHS